MGDVLCHSLEPHRMGNPGKKRRPARLGSLGAVRKLSLKKLCFTSPYNFKMLFHSIFSPFNGFLSLYKA